ncbi:MAG: hypothetical protein NVS3B14_12300 [Ktedonobacteraceae bacterium]
MYPIITRDPVSGHELIVTNLRTLAHPQSLKMCRSNRPEMPLRPNRQRRLATPRRTSIRSARPSCA